MSTGPRSIHRDEIDAALVSRLVASQFPQWAELSVRPVTPSGWDNKTFHLGDELSVRLPSAQDYVAQVAKEHQWLPRLATDLARFLIALKGIDPTGGPLPRPHDFQRGGPLPTYDRETHQAIATLDGKIDSGAATEVWEAAIAAAWRGSPVWVHGDFTTGNLLVEQGRMSAVIDFGTCGVQAILPAT